jgi:hypothetical protein
MGFTPALNHYLSWVNNRVEPTLRNYFLDAGLWTSLRGDAYWHIQRMTESSPRWSELVEGEMKRQAELLETLEATVRSLVARANAAIGVFAVLDTHVLLHYQPPAEVPWPTVVGHAEVRLVLPLRVIEELDEKKYTARDDLADRARRLLSQLRTQLAPTAGLPARLRDRVSIEVPVDDGPRHRPLDADQEVLEVCSDFKALGRPTFLVTGDTGLAIRAANRHLETITMPAEYLRVRSQPASKEEESGEASAKGAISS